MGRGAAFLILRSQRFSSVLLTSTQVVLDGFGVAYMTGCDGEWLAITRLAVLVCGKNADVMETSRLYAVYDHVPLRGISIPCTSLEKCPSQD